MSIYKKLFQRFHELPDNLPANNYRFWVFLNHIFFLAAAVHFLFIFMFALVGVKPLALFNVASTIIWAFSVYINLKGYSRTGLTLGSIEIVLHAWLCLSLIHI